MDLSNSDSQSSVLRASFSSVPNSKVEDRYTQAGAGFYPYGVRDQASITPTQIQ